MKNTDIFDVLVVYNSNIAISASSTKSDTPFDIQSEHNDYNSAYAYFLEYCKSKKLHAAFIASNDIVGPGTGKAYWTWEDGRWLKHKRKCYTKMVFNKFFPRNEAQQEKYDVLFSDNTVQVLPKKKLVALFTDKQVTADLLPDYTIPTVSITDTSTVGIETTVLELEQIVASHANSHDFSPAVILKDRFGLGGSGIYKIKRSFVAQISSIIQQNPETEFIIQPLLKYDKGYSTENYTGYADIRLIYYDNKLVQAYVRTAKPGDFRCNTSLGGDCFYLHKSEIQPAIRTTAKKIIKTINIPNALFALDFLISNSGNIYFVEGNSSPGIYWTHGVDKEEVETKKLIHILVNELADRISAQNHISTIQIPSTTIEHTIAPRLELDKSKKPTTPITTE